MRILITGAAGGLGSYLAKRERTLGHTVLGLDREAEAEGRGAIFWGKVETVLGGPVEAVILAQGATKIWATDDHTVKDFVSVLHDNLVSPFETIRGAILRQTQNGNGIRFIAIGSASAHQAMSKSHGYCASKAGLEALMRVFARDCAALSHLFFTVAPGALAGTPMTDVAIQAVINSRPGFTTREMAEAHLARNPLGRLTTLEEVASVVEFCLVEAPQAMSGTTFKMPMCSGVE